MSETWRYVDCSAVDAFENNAQMAVFARSTIDAGQPILQTSVWGATHLNVGWFDHAGDMHVAPPDTLDRVAAALTGADGGDGAEIRRRLAAVFEGPEVHQADATTGVTTDDLVAAVRKAVEDALGGAA